MNHLAHLARSARRKLLRRRLFPHQQRLGLGTGCRRRRGSCVAERGGRAARGRGGRGRRCECPLRCPRLHEGERRHERDRGLGLGQLRRRGRGRRRGWCAGLGLRPLQFRCAQHRARRVTLVRLGLGATPCARDDDVASGEHPRQHASHASHRDLPETVMRDVHDVAAQPDIEHDHGDAIREEFRRVRLQECLPALGLHVRAAAAGEEAKERLAEPMAQRPEVQFGHVDEHPDGLHREQHADGGPDASEQELLELRPAAHGCLTPPRKCAACMRDKRRRGDGARASDIGTVGTALEQA
mmetsp:Transcript_80353/g.245624  ORF Transcript_80353/g.245624 Transcript_80353/m.245624 type:complete len:298 (+) Transcript_80353:88-981(+)